MYSREPSKSRLQRVFIINRDQYRVVVAESAEGYASVNQVREYVATRRLLGDGSRKGGFGANGQAAVCIVAEEKRF